MNADQKEIKTKISTNKDKVRIFAGDQINKLNGKVEKKDKKNIVKNLIKIFLAWLDKKNTDTTLKEFEDIKEEMKKLLSKENFNNRLIKEMIENKMINRQFLHFLTDTADEDVKASRINDKESHYEAIKLYILFLRNYFEEEKKNYEIKHEVEGKSTEKEKSEEKSKIK